MSTVRTTAELRAAVAAGRGAGPVGFVPTMGALHAGHESLIRRARSECALVVVSVFVNPTQFDDPADLDAYPRSAERDVAVAAAAGADLVFLPEAGELYPPGDATRVVVRGPLTESLEGAHRGAGHFDGVTTVVARLLNLVGPDRAYFGAKDAQQALVVRRMARDLRLPVEIVTCPTVRDADGLALSSRNARLSPAERERALSLSRALGACAEAIADGRLRHGAEAADAGLRALAAGGAEPEYFAVVDPETLEPAGPLEGELLLACAARVGDVRLIDNLSLTVPQFTDEPEAATREDRAPTAAT
ncbi:MAG: pantoate--beta-alanine ligase [Solirubrobacteraceae bacterium]|nr:pantoate--beta-alanine ligase [Solirubrobacteraceae bacterium]